MTFCSVFTFFFQAYRRRWSLHVSNIKNHADRQGLRTAYKPHVNVYPLSRFTCQHRYHTQDHHGQRENAIINFNLEFRCKCRIRQVSPQFFCKLNIITSLAQISSLLFGIKNWLIFSGWKRGRANVHQCREDILQIWGFQRSSTCVFECHCARKNCAQQTDSDTHLADSRETQTEGEMNRRTSCNKFRMAWMYAPRSRTKEHTVMPQSRVDCD